MPYTIYKYNGTAVATVADGTLDQTLDLKIVGKNYAGYGIIQNENFVYLLENFANNNAPGKPTPGQVWYDTANNKLRFYDVNGNWRITGGSTTATSLPTGLTSGDFWYDSSNNQLYVWNGTAPVLIGPQGVAGSGTTQMKSASVRDTLGNTHAIIQAIVNNQTVFIISADALFSLESSTNTTLVNAGFGDIHQGVTLAYTNNNSQLGQTTGNQRFWGTASNSERLGGYDISNFTLSSNATFSTLVQFADVGYTVGNPAKLRVYNDANTTPTIYNQLNDTIVFTTTSNNTPVSPMKLVGSTVQPGTSNTCDLGTTINTWRNVYATTFSGTALRADRLGLGGSYISADTAATSNTIAARTAVDQTINGVNVTAGSLFATYFSGTATAANYADLAEKYLADQEYETGTVVAVGGVAEVTACTLGDRAIGAVSANPAFMMNQELVGGTYIALKGRVPVKVSGPVRKGDRLIAGNDGTATLAHDNLQETFAIALETSDDIAVKLVECLVL